MVLGRARIHPRRPDSTLEPLAHTRGSVPGRPQSVHHRSKRPRISKSRSTLRAKLLKGLGLPRNWVCLVFSPSTAARRPMAFHDLAMRFSDSLLRLFYRGRLGFPRTKDQKLLKTKDVAVCDRQIGVGPTAPWQEFSNWCERDPISSRQEMRASKKAAGLGQTTAQALWLDRSGQIGSCPRSPPPISPPADLPPCDLPPCVSPSPNSPPARACAISKFVCAPSNHGSTIWAFAATSPATRWRTPT